MVSCFLGFVWPSVCFSFCQIKVFQFNSPSCLSSVLFDFLLGSSTQKHLNILRAYLKNVYFNNLTQTTQTTFSSTMFAPVSALFIFPTIPHTILPLSLTCTLSSAWHHLCLPSPWQKVPGYIFFSPGSFCSTLLLLSEALLSAPHTDERNLILIC